MNPKIKSLLRNLNYTVTANVVAFFISVILSIFVPKFVGIKEYSYWQLYVFYSSYVIFFQLGWLEGIYLKLGGKDYENLEKDKLGSQFWYFLLYQLLIGLIIITTSISFTKDMDKQFILVMVGIVTIISNIKLLCAYILQSTNRIKEYAKLSRNDKYLYFFIISFYLLVGGRNYKYLIFFDIISKLVITFWGVYCIRDLLTIKILPFKSVNIEILDNIKIGSNLMLASIANLFILGTTRFFVEKKWSIEVFGSLSFALSLSNMFMLLMNSIGTVLFPMLRREREEALPILYLKIRNVFIPFVFSLLLFYYPGRIFLLWLLPEYKISIYYMGLLFPMIIYEGRVSLLTNTYFKTMRQEKTIFYINLITWFFSSILSLIAIFYYESINLTVLVIIFSLAFRAILAEEILAKKLKIDLGYSNLIETIVTVIFIFGNIYLSSFKGLTLYLIVYSLLFLFYWKKIKSSVHFFKMISKKKM